MTVTKKDIAFKRKIDKRVFDGRPVARKDILRALDIKRNMDANRRDAINAKRDAGESVASADKEFVARFERRELGIDA